MSADESSDNDDIENVIQKSQTLPIHSLMGPEHNGSPDFSPSSHVDHPWLCAERESFRYDEANGKWLMFFPRNVIDERWQTAKELYFGGDLPKTSAIKVSTAMPSNRSTSAEHVIVFFCGPADQEAVVKEIGMTLTKRFPPESSVIYYKSDAQTKETLATISGSSNKSKKWMYRLNCLPSNGPEIPDVVVPLSDSDVAASKSASEEEESPEEENEVEMSENDDSPLGGNGLIMVLDTETTGFPPNAPPENTAAWKYCRMLELAWHIYDSTGVLQSKENFLIKPDFDFEVPSGAVKVHGITKEKAQKEGVDLKIVVETFLKNLRGVSKIVGHNISFDVKILLSEIHKSGFAKFAEIFEKIPKECTMLMGVTMMPGGRRAKLAVLFEECFGQAPDGTMHRADADVDACAKIYFYLAAFRQTDRHSNSASNSDSNSSSDELTPPQDGSSPSSTVSSVSEESVEDEVDEGKNDDFYFFDGNVFQNNAVVIAMSLAVASTAVFIYSFAQ